MRDGKTIYHWVSRRSPALVALLPIALLCVVSTVHAHDEEDADKGGVDGGGGVVGGPYPTQNMRLLSTLPLDQMGVTESIVRGNDIWGWTDPVTGGEYALFGLTNATTFIDVSDPANPIHVGTLPTQTGNKVWRDIKIYQDHAFVVADNNGAHGMQIFDLTQLRNYVDTPLTFTNTAHYDGFTEAHNIVINEETGYAYAVGADYRGGMHFIDISDPTNPVAAGGFSGAGYTHDAQVVTYTGPDTDYTGREIAFNSNGDSHSSLNQDEIVIVDVTDKTAPALISSAGYDEAGYTHQGWLTQDQKYFLSNDELDERDEEAPLTRTHIWDVQDLDNPSYMGFYEGPVGSIDHNTYTYDNRVAYLANYTSGLRVLDITDIANGNLAEIGFVDTHPADDAVGFDGAWSVYPYFESGTIIVSDRDEGLFVIQHLPGDANRDGGVTVGDLSILASSFGGPGVWDTGDFNGDGMVTIGDLSLLSSHFGEGVVDESALMAFDEALALVGLQSVPEPVSGVLLVLGGTVMALARWRNDVPHGTPLR